MLGRCDCFIGFLGWCISDGTVREGCVLLCGRVCAYMDCLCSDSFMCSVSCYEKSDKGIPERSEKAKAKIFKTGQKENHHAERMADGNRAHLSKGSGSVKEKKERMFMKADNIKEQIIEFERQEVCEKTLIEFYDAVGKMLGATVESATYDCRKINISKGIQDGFYETYRRLFQEKYQGDIQRLNEDITALLLISGPKVSEKLNGFCVEVLPGFLCTNS